MTYDYIFHNAQGDLLAISLRNIVPEITIRYGDTKEDEKLGVVSLNYSYFTKNESGLYHNCIVTTCYREERKGIATESYLCDLTTWTFVRN